MLEGGQAGVYRHFKEADSGILYAMQMVGCMSGFIRGLDRENYDSIASRVTQHGAKLLKKPDQCRAVLSCSHLYWNAVSFSHYRWKPDKLASIILRKISFFEATDNGNR